MHNPEGTISPEGNAPHLNRLRNRYKKHKYAGRLIPSWVDTENPHPVEIPRGGLLRRVAGWIEEADLRQLNVDIREYLSDSYLLRNGETIVVINKRRDRVAVVLRQFGLIFHTSKATGTLSAELTASILVRKILG